MSGCITHDSHCSCPLLSHPFLRLAPISAGHDIDPTNFSYELDWNIRAFLPPSLQAKFESVVSYFIGQMFKAKQAAHSSGQEPLRAIQPTSTQAANGQPAPLDPTREQEVNQAKKTISKSLTRRMLALVQDILVAQRIAHTDPDVAAGLTFPLLPGAHLKSTNAALEFIKTTCHVFGIARELQAEVQVLKRNLLDFVGVREFSDLAVFRNPCEVIKLPAVICPQCQSVRDLDLCRDPERLPQLTEMESEDGTTEWVLNPPRSNVWLCERGHVLDSAGIEIRLVDHVQRLMLQYQLQDVSFVSTFLFLFALSLGDCLTFVMIRRD